MAGNSRPRCAARWSPIRAASHPARSTAHTFLYLTLGNGTAIRYGIGVGRSGFTWSGIKTISRKTEWPDWIPPAEMIARQPYLPRWVGGGPGNPLGARALYLGNTAYRIHGTNDPRSIGKHVPSGCIRLRNEDVVDLYDRVGVGAKVVVLASDPRNVASGEHRSTPVERTTPIASAGAAVTRISTQPGGDGIGRSAPPAVRLEQQLEQQSHLVRSLLTQSIGHLASGRCLSSQFSSSKRNRTRSRAVWRR
jgi:hypothetical protein